MRTAIIRYNVLDASGGIHYGRTEAQMDVLVSAGGKIQSTVRHKGEEAPAPSAAPPPPSPTVAPTSPSDLVLKARLSGVEGSIEEQLQLFAEGKITQEELQRRKEAIEGAHVDWYTGFEKTGATEAESKAIIEARGAESAAQLESTVEQILTMEAKGEITHEQSVEAVQRYQEEQRGEVRGIISGEDVLAGESGLSIGYQFVEPKVVLTAAEDVGEAPSEAPLEAPPALEGPPGTYVPPESELEHRQREREWTADYVPPVAREDPVISDIIEPEVTAVTTVESVAPGMVTHMGVTMTREQFEADFPPGTMPDVSRPSPAKLVTVLPDPSTFVGIPGPAAPFRPGSLGEKYQNILVGKLTEIEEGFVSFETGMRQAGREMGAEAQVAAKEGDVGQALLMGGLAFTTRLGTGILEGGSFLGRPLAWKRTAEGLVAGGKQAIEHPEEIPSGVVKWAANIARDPGAIVQFAGDIAAGYAIAEVISTLKGPTAKVSRVEALDIDVKAKALGMVDEVDPFTGKTVKVPQFPEAEFTPTVTQKRIPKVVSELMEAELDEIISGKTKIMGVADEAGITRLDLIEISDEALQDLARGKPVTVDAPVSIETVGLGSETISYLDELTDPLTGRSMKVLRKEKALPLDAKELGPPINIFDEASKFDELILTKGEKILEDIIEFKPPRDVVDGPVKFGGPWLEEGVEGVLEPGKYRYDVKGIIIEDMSKIVDDLPDFKPLEPRPGPKTPLSKTFGAGADVIQETIVKEITEGITPIAKVIKEPAVVPKDVPIGVGVGAALEEVTSIIDETAKPARRVVEGPPGAFGELGAMPGLFTGFPQVDKERGRLPSPYFFTPEELKKKLKQEEDLARKLEEPKPIPIDIVLGPKVEVKPVLIPPLFKPQPIDVGPKPKLKTEPKPPQFEPFPVEDIMTIVKPKPKVTPKPKPFPPIIEPVQIVDVPPIIEPTPQPFPPIVEPIEIPVVVPIVEPIQEPIQEPIIIPPIQIVEQEQRVARPAPFLHLLEQGRPRRPIRQREEPPRRRRPSPFDPLGFEERKYPMSSIEDVLGIGGRRAPRRTARARDGLRDPSEILLGGPSRKGRMGAPGRAPWGGPMDPSEILLGRPQKDRKTKKKRAKPKTKPKKRKKKR